MATSGKLACMLEVPSDDPQAAKAAHLASDQLASTAKMGTSDARSAVGYACRQANKTPQSHGSLRLAGR